MEKILNSPLNQSDVFNQYVNKVNTRIDYSRQLDNLRERSLDVISRERLNDKLTNAASLSLSYVVCDVKRKRQHWLQLLRKAYYTNTHSPELIPPRRSLIKLSLSDATLRVCKKCFIYKYPYSAQKKRREMRNI